MNLFNCLRVVTATAALSLSYAAPAISEAAAREASAPITVSATVIRPVGLTFISADPSSPAWPASEADAAEARRLPADAFLAQFPSESSLLMLVETGGRLVDRFALSGDRFEQPDPSMDGETLSGVRLLESETLLGSVPSGSTDCTVTLIYTEN